MYTALLTHFSNPSKFKFLVRKISPFPKKGNKVQDPQQVKVKVNQNMWLIYDGYRIMDVYMNVEGDKSKDEVGYRIMDTSQWIQNKRIHENN